MVVDKSLESNSVWDVKWEELFDSYQQDLRHAYYVNALLNKEMSILEIAAGSFRDMAFLNSIGYDCHGCDFSKKSVSLAKKYFPKLEDKIFELDALDINNFNKKYDVTYHNGFWVLFESDDILKKLFNIQKSITKKFMIITVHNGHNQNFKRYFMEKQKKDNLYAIRFFEIDEFLDIFGLARNDIQLYPVGKAKLSHEDLLVKDNNVDKSKMLKFMRPNNLDLLGISERLLIKIPIN
jgi:hypothetical protein